VSQRCDILTKKSPVVALFEISTHGGRASVVRARWVESAGEKKKERIGTRGRAVLNN
jgi:hypothetical protein